MKKLTIYQVDAFTSRLFSGNSAAVCFTDTWLEDSIMQSIATENNLAETAFIVPVANEFEIRWYTPAIEVELCGHATLASGFLLFNHLGYEKPEIIFNSKRSGVLKVVKQAKSLFLDFPTDTLLPADNYEAIEKCIGICPNEILKGKTDYIAVLESEYGVKNINPVFSEIEKLDSRGLIVTARGEEVDFVSRFFAPQSGIYEDPVTGSAHTSLIPLWSEKLKKKNMLARQLSQRGGELMCIYNRDRCLIGGDAVLYMTGEIYLT